MKYDFFINTAINQDKRNKFKKCKQVSNVPEELMDFYRENDPIDVEVSILGRMTVFFGYKKLPAIQREYQLEDGFVFASCNGEPIYIKDGSIYTCTFGKKGIKETKIADSFDLYLKYTDKL